MGTTQATSPPKLNHCGVMLALVLSIGASPPVDNARRSGTAANTPTHVTPQGIRTARDTIPKTRTVPLASDAPFRAVSAIASAPSTEAQTMGGTGEVLAFSNTLGIATLEMTAGVPVADDITLTTIADCGLRSYRFRVVGKAVPDACGGAGESCGPFGVTFGLYDLCPNAGGELIPKTGSTVTFGDDGAYEIEFVVPPGVDAVVPNRVWLSVEVDRNNAGVVLAGPALQGFSQDAMDTGDAPCGTTIGGFPDFPHASFYAEVVMDAACEAQHPTYQNTRSANEGVRTGARLCIADDIRLHTTCTMSEMEVAVRGVGRFDVELRRRHGAEPVGNCNDFTAFGRDAVAGSHVAFVNSDDTHVKVFRRKFNPPVPLPAEDLFVVFMGNNTNTAWVQTGVDASIGSTDGTYYTFDGDRTGGTWIARTPEDGGFGAFHVAITCDGPAPLGACCDMLATDGAGESVCRDVAKLNCAFPELWERGARCTSVCNGGTSAGMPCTRHVDCPGGTCPGPFVESCGLAACCQDDGSCENLTQNECLHPADANQFRSFEPGQYCDVGTQLCPSPECRERAGGCLSGGEGTCVGGSATGQPCDPADSCAQSECCQSGGVCEGNPGCDSPECCTKVCGLYGHTFCCDDHWDADCAELAGRICSAEQAFDECYRPDLNSEAKAITLDKSIPVDLRDSTESFDDPTFCCHESGPESPGLGTVWFRFLAPPSRSETETTTSVRLTVVPLEPNAPLVSDPLMQVFSTAHPDQGRCNDGTVCSLAGQDCADTSICEHDQADACESLAFVTCSAGEKNCVTGLVPGQTYYLLLAAESESGRGRYELSVSSYCDPDPLSTDVDCNGNHLVDVCDIHEGIIADCNANALPDDCETDCNRNQVPDDCDLRDGTSPDCNANSVPDDCDSDCNGNGVPDDCDLRDLTSADCNNNGIPDECGDNDCDSNGVPDVCEAPGTFEDCNADGRADSCGAFGTCEVATLTRSAVFSNEQGFPGPMAIDARLMVVGTPDRSEFIAHVYRHDGQQWNLEGPLHVAGNGSGFGAAVAVSNNLILVSPNLSFRFDGNQWVRESNLVPDISSLEQFNLDYGVSVAASGNTVLVGAPGGPFRDDGAGSIFVFRSEGTGWEQTARLTVPESEDADRFGEAVSLDGDLALVGAPDRRTVSDAKPGSAFLFRASGYDWRLEAVLHPSHGAPGDGFGKSVAIRGDKVIVGAPYADCANREDCGVAYVYRLSQGQWSEEARLVSPSKTGTRFGESVATNGELVMVGAPEDDVSNDCTNCGAAYVYRPEAGSWVEHARLTSLDPAVDDRFGSAVALGRDSAAVKSAPGTCRSDYPERPCGPVHMFAISGEDCDCNDVADVCEIEDGTLQDCNTNGIPDRCDLADNTSQDCNDDGILNECEEDCQGNGIADGCDIAAGTSADCNDNVIPDECELTGPDCNRNGIDDATELGTPVVVEELTRELWAFFPCDSFTSSPLDLFGVGEATLSFLIDPTRAAYEPFDVEYWDGQEWQLWHREPPLPGQDRFNMYRELDLPREGMIREAKIRLSTGMGPQPSYWALKFVVFTYREHDCNDTAVLDSCEVEACGVEDCNHNGVPDQCDLAPSRIDSIGRNPDIVPRAIAHADFDQDGDIDLAVAGCHLRFGSPYGVLLFLNNGRGEFIEGASTRDEGGKSIAAGDFNGDGYPDVVMINRYLTVYLNNGESWPQLVRWSRLPPLDTASAVVVADVDGDADVDIIAVVAEHSPSAGWVEVLINDGAARFTPVRELDTDESLLSIVVLDANNDGLPDLAVTGRESLTLAINNGKDESGEWQGYTVIGRIPLELQEPFSLVAADFDRDGLTDFAVTARTSTGLAGAVTLLNQGNDANGAWAGLKKALNAELVLYGSTLFAADLNADGWADLTSATGEAMGTMIVQFNLGYDEKGEWRGLTAAETYEVAGCPSSVTGADLNANHSVDLVVASPGCDSIRLGSDASSLLVIKRQFEQSLDCNANAVPDECDLASGLDDDCDGDGTPDACQPDCNANATPDACDIAFGGATDCNENLIPDACDLLAQPGSDCNGTGVPDTCERFGDGDGDGDVRLDDYGQWLDHLTGPTPVLNSAVCLPFDADAGGTVDLRDFARFQRVFYLVGQQEPSDRTK